MQAGQEILDFIGMKLLDEPPDPPLRLDEDLLERAPIDSLGVVELVEFLESTYGVRIAAREVTITNFRTAEAMLRLVGEKRSGGT